MKKQTSEHGSQVQTERYLLNKMSPDEETLFQIHLEECEDCRSYVNTVRRLSCLIADEELGYTDMFAEKKEAKVQKKLRFRSIISIAACIVLITGISIFLRDTLKDGYGGSIHETHINRQSKTDKVEMAIEMLFPDKEEVSLQAGQPLEFKWNKVTAYQLIVRHGDRTIVETGGFGEYYLLSAKKMKGLSVLDWVLVIENKEFKGKIHINV